ncbi:uncharacterized protein J3D65DRAFT_475749 [Phyllosticta citribraziliensis]|uniref:Uncharacterized protein n=1 Tax=Phyllosticta citribraziliensis TaxID=989973 RepID=A0ABR1LG28_9PEZI
MASARAGRSTPESGSADLLASNHQITPSKASSQSPSKQTAQNNISTNGIQPNTSEGSDNDQGQGQGDDEGADEADAEEDEGRIIAPSGGSGLGKGKRPGIRIDSVDMSREEGRKAGTTQENGLAPGPNKKRTFSSTSILSNLESHHDEHGQRDADYPRRKMARTLGEDELGLMAYEGEQKGIPAGVPEHVLDSSDDDEIYKAVEDIDPSDNDEYIDETLEEKAIRKAFKNSSDDESDFGEVDGDGPDVSMLLQNGLIDDEFFTIDDDSAPAFPSSYWDDEWPVHEETANALNPEEKPTTRRVRFDDQVHTVSDIDSDETSSEDLNSYWPDLFQNDPLVFRASNDPENVLDETASDSERSYWDFGDDKDKLSDWDDDQDENAESDSESEAGSSGYETDEGDTTDEELPPPPTITTPARIHRDSTSSTSSATPKPLPRTRKMLPPKKPNKRKGPMRGFFAVDPKRALAYIDGTGKRMVLIPGRVRDGSSWAVSTASSTANNSPKSQLMNADESEFSDTNNQTLSNLMALGGFFGTDLDLALTMSNQWSAMGDDDLIDEDFDEDDDDDDMENMLDVADFIDFGQSDSEEADETDAPTDGSPTKAHAGHTPAKSAAHEMSEKMLQHFDRGNVTSFRRNQNRYRDIARLPDDPALRASASRPVRTGASADAIITPMRKKKRAKDPDTLQPRASPLARKTGPIAGTFAPRRV